MTSDTCEVYIPHTTTQNTDAEKERINEWRKKRSIKSEQHADEEHKGGEMEGNIWLAPGRKKLIVYEGGEKNWTNNGKETK